MATNKPRVFVSSTIYDFRDLRSAIKYWLEQHGYEVWLSDQTDFPQNPALNSYESCLRAIDDSDYFILLIGGRVGGWYDEQARVSITRAEYRWAYERAKLGKLKLMTFVRREIWDIREDRSQLRRFLASEHGKELELSDADIRAITAHPSKFLIDAEAVFDFLKEVGRVQEMKEATASEGGRPLGNWIHQFVTFGDIADALKVGMRITGSLRRVTLAANLKHELLQNLCRVMYKTDSGDVQPDHFWGSTARPKFKGGMNGTSSFSGEDLTRLGYLLLKKAGIGKQLSTMALHEVITSGEFLEFDLSINQFVAGTPQRALLYLSEAIKRLCWAEEHTDNLGPQLIAKHRDRKRETFRVNNADVLVAIVIHDNLCNATQMSKALYRYLQDGNEAHLDSSVVQTYPTAPFLDDVEQVKKETPQSHEVLGWIFDRKV